MTQTPQQKAIESLKYRFPHKVLFCRDELKEALDICAKEAEKQGYEKALKHTEGALDKCYNKARQEGAEHKAKEIFDDIEDEMNKCGKGNSSITRMNMSIILSKLEQKHLKEVKR